MASVTPQLTVSIGPFGSVTAAVHALLSGT